MDPLTIGAADDESKKHRDTLELEIPTANLVAAIYPDEPAPVGDATEAARAALEEPVDGPTFSELLAGKSSIAVIIDNQFRPTPSSKLLPAVFDAIEAAGITDVRVVCANGKVFPMSESDMEQKLGRENLARMEGTAGPSSRTTRGTPTRTRSSASPRAARRCGCTTRSRGATSKITIGQAQANHWGAGGGGKLILPGVVSDETIESNHCAFVTSPQTHYGAYAGPMRSDIDEVATMCGLDCTMNVVLDTHGRVIDCIFGSHPEAHREAIRRFNSIYAYESPVEEQGQADIAICGVFAPTDHLFFHTGWGCMSADLVLKDGGTIIYTSPSPGVSTAIGDFPGLALMDLMKPYMPPTPRELPARPARHPHARDPDVGRLHLGADLRGDDAQAPDDRHARGEPRDGGRHRHRRDDVARRGVRGGDGAPRRRTRRWSCCRSRATSCRATRSGWRRRIRACWRTRWCDAAHGRDSRLPAGGRRRRRRRRPRQIRGSTTIVEILRMYPGRAGRALMSRLCWPCAHCGGAFHEPLTLAAKRHGATRGRCSTRSARSRTAARTSAGGARRRARVPR